MNPKRLISNTQLSLLMLAFPISCMGQQKLSIAGTWYFRMDTADKGISEKWFMNYPLSQETILLPGSMPQRNKGFTPTLHTQWTASIYDSSWYFDPDMAKFRQPDSLKFPFFLTPKKYYVGPAWYQRKIKIPENLNHQCVILYLERVHWQSTVWIDSVLIGQGNSLSCPHEFVLPENIKPGTHLLTIRVDNRILNINPGKDSHSLTDQTQGNWNGIVGKMFLIAHPLCYIKNIQTFPDIVHQQVIVHLSISNQTKKSIAGKIQLNGYSFNTTEKLHVDPLQLPVHLPAGDTTLSINYNLGKKIALWDEFHPSLYHLTVQLQTQAGKDIDSTDFGMREFKTEGTYFTVNGKKTFIRGTVENCDFPLTGYPPMDVNAWLRIFKICKSYGLNEMRFHSYCPPEAAFKAADLTGMYLHVEGPSWANHGSSLGDGHPIDQYIYDETNRIDQYYGNHPSFCMMAYGNEPRGAHQVAYLNAFVDYWKQKDPRHLYTGASVGMSWPWVKEEQFIVRSGPRGLPWANESPNTLFDYQKAIAGHDIPYVAHEMGQYCAFPDFKQINQYTGVMQPRNFELFRDILNEHHLGDEAENFLMASGKLQLLCYKGEIEAALRTPGMAGFELLALNDYTGQGTALVGVLNVFWQSKGYVTPSIFSSFCNAVTPLARIPKFTYYNTDTFQAYIQIANFSPKPLQQALIKWTIRNDKNHVLAESQFLKKKIPIGNDIIPDTIRFPLYNIEHAEKCTLSIEIAGTPYRNQWSFWVYPHHQIDLHHLQNIYITHEFDSSAVQALSQGKNVLLLCADHVILGKDVSMHFLPVFWNTSWFKMRPPHTTGIFVDTTHPLFKYFPTAYYQDFQWWSIANKQPVMWIKDFPPAFKPIVQPIDTWFRNRRLALIWEAKVGKGKILACSSDLETNSKKYPEANQLLYAIIQYMQSSAFQPKYVVSVHQIESLFSSNDQSGTYHSFTTDAPDELNKKQ
ncbi:Glycosyl hydrolases family 2, TIM barrel domain [Thermoflavifilum thermophilum]|uniref:beta-galactosidase n=2 Tax=Thermoflavifilum thermophilum TaxID=1393122 RepID=A0A1I7NIZ3_9BACT|nr:Glycosyl hydrolases family 2, TIM barrel domain [Thermoflavifilum thermophilum]